jgi:hypothetical protein
VGGPALAFEHALSLLEGVGYVGASTTLSVAITFFCSVGLPARLSFFCFSVGLRARLDQHLDQLLSVVLFAYLHVSIHI